MWSAVSFGPSARLLSTGTQSGQVCIYDLTQGVGPFQVNPSTQTLSKQLQWGAVWSVAFSPDQMILAVGFGSRFNTRLDEAHRPGDVCALAVDSGQVLFTLQISEQEPAYGLAFGLSSHIFSVASCCISAVDAVSGTLLWWEDLGRCINVVACGAMCVPWCCLTLGAAEFDPRFAAPHRDALVGNDFVIQNIEHLQEPAYLDPVEAQHLSSQMWASMVEQLPSPKNARQVVEDHTQERDSDSTCEADDVIR
jgi:hypothetical protein